MRTAVATAIALTLSVAVCAGGPDVSSPASSPSKPQQNPVPNAQLAKPRVAAKPLGAKRAEFEISAMTSETTDQLYGRINLSSLSGPSKWFIKAGYGATTTRSYSGASIYETELDTYSLDSQYRKDGKSGYRFVSATAQIRNRSPYTVTYGDKSGYYMLSTGVGRKLLPGIESEIALARAGIYDHGSDHGYALVTSFRWKRGLTDALALDGHAYFLRPTSEDAMVDARTDFTYKFTDNLSIRLTYVANNLMRPITTRTGWDRSLRVSLVFSRTTN